MEPQTTSGAPDCIKVAVLGDSALVVVGGKATFRSGEALRRFARKAIAQGCDRFIFDMCQCVNMDSTFMGVVAGVAMRLDTELGGKVFIINLSAKTRSLLDTLGIDAITSLHLAGEVPAEVKSALSAASGLETLCTTGADRLFTLETMLAAHNDLVRVSEGNRPKFKDVMAYLTEELESYRGN
jgi:anti-anti-sigma regulatory factor